MTQQSILHKAAARLSGRAFGSLARHLPFNAAMVMADRLLAGQGFGSGSRLTKSGELEVIRSLKGKAPVLFDVGAHVGEYTEAFLECHPEGNAYCFEPSAHHFSLLVQRLGERSNVRLFQTALGASAGSATLHTNEDVSGLASLTKRRLDHFGIQMEKSETVNVDTVDNVLKNAGVTRVDLLKIDVEGHELDVLRGAIKALQDQIVKRVQFEFGGCNLDTRTTLQDFFYFFQDLAYDVGVVQPSGRVHPLPEYREVYEQYRTTNFLARPAG